MSTVQKEPAGSWNALRKYTSARIALGHTGGSLRTVQRLQLSLDHAQAKDAVGYELDWARIAGEYTSLFPEVLLLSTRAGQRSLYLQRPDLGKQLDARSVKILEEAQIPPSMVCIVAADGLSPLALERHLIPLMSSFLPLLHGKNFSHTPLFFVKGGRVAIGDEIGERLGSDLVVVCIGERPGLSSRDSLGLYITYRPKVGTTDESRNCISNIRNEGLQPHLAAEELFSLIERSLRLRLSGVHLKDDSDPRLTAGR